MVVGSTIAGTVLLAPLSSTAGAATAPTKSPGQVASATVSPHLINAPFSIRLEDQLLAYLGYLPVKFTPYVKKTVVKKKRPPSTTTTSTTTSTTSTTTTTPSSTSTTTPVTTTTVKPVTTSTVKPVTTTTVRPVKKKQVKALNWTQVFKGTFTWRFSAFAKILGPQFQVGTDNAVLHGALMHFQDVHGLPTYGNMDTPTWQTLLKAVVTKQFDPTPYNYVVVTQGLPQHLDLYINGRHTYTSLVNTGIGVAPTSNGTYPVYLRYSVTTMSGTNPNGTKYHDTGIPWTSYFHGGDALHGFLRGSYGSPQSLGCVEMPFANAGIVWPNTPIGTLVTVR